MVELEARTAKSTKTTVVLYKTTGYSDGNYATACYPHGGIVYHETRSVARSWMADPEGWCPDCQELRNKKNKSTPPDVFEDDCD